MSKNYIGDKMKGFKAALFLFLIAFSFSHAQQHLINTPVEREKLLMDFNWRFHFGNSEDYQKDFNYGLAEPFAKSGAGNSVLRTDFVDTSWRKLDLPHDWAVELDFENRVHDDQVVSHGYKPIGKKFPETSVGWYRKTFTIPSVERGKRFTIKFDGVFRDSHVWFNGHLLGRNLSGYSEFSYDITDYINYDKTNAIVVRVDATFYEGWFYEGAGIYRHVWMIKTNPLHIPLYGTYVRSEVMKGSADVIIETDLKNQFNSGQLFTLHSLIMDEKNNIVGKNSTRVDLHPFDHKKIKENINLKNPSLWSIESPVLYKLISIIEKNGKVIDRIETNFGIRTISFDKDKGFFLNGKHVKIKGVCCHQDHAGVGSALPDRLQYYRIELLKEMGCNAYRASHNPPTNELLEACDKLGMLVLDENRLMGSSPEFMQQFETLILRDRNHPSIIAWCLGNEEWVVQTTEIGKNIALSLMQTQKRLDPSRLSTYAANTPKYEGVNSVIDLRGFNYMNNCNIDNYRNEHPEQILWGTEEASTLCTRGVYSNIPEEGFMADYDTNAPPWGSTAEVFWKFYDERDWLAGGFVWTGFDYRGEPTPYKWPCINSHFGIMDVCGFPKNVYYYYQSWWSDKDVLHIFPHWNWNGKTGETINVWCYSNCESVELFLNGKSLGKKDVRKNSHLEWNVVYEPGTLEARGIKNGKVITKKIVTTGETYTIVLTPDRQSINADGEDVSVINITAVDKDGNEVPTANESLIFDIKGNGKIIGVGNGNPSSHEADKFIDGNYKRSLFNGKCQVIVQSTKSSGEIILTARSERIKPASAVIKSNAMVLRPVFN